MPEEGIGSSGTGIADVIRHVGAVNRTPGPLQEQLVFLTAKPSSELQALCSFSGNRQLPEIDTEFLVHFP